MKLRIWTGKETLASIHGKEVSSFEAFEDWLKKQPDGAIEVWAGRWWAISKEAVPFVWKGGKCFCAHPSFQSKTGRNPADFSGFFAFEAWEKAKKVSGFFSGIEKMAGEIVEAAGKP